MANNYGYIFTKDSVKEQLKNMNRTHQGRQTWGEYYGAIDVAKQDALSKVTHDYSSDVLEAYKTAEENKYIIANSALGQGYKEEAFKDIDASLMQAYDTYRQTYANNVASVESNVDAQKVAIDKALDVEATNMQSMLNSGYDYLTDLYNRAYGLGDYKNAGEDEALKKRFESDAQWSKYLSQTTNENGNKLLLTQSELYSQLFDKNNELTLKGTDFYDQMINQLGTELGENYSYYDWLNKTNPELFEWSQSYNPYDYTETGTNIGTFKNMVNLQSTDNKYMFIERFGGMTRDEITNKMNEFTNKIKDNYDNYSDAVTNVDTAIDEIEQWSKDLGIHNELGKELGGWANLKSTFKKYADDLHTTDELDEIYSDEFWSTVGDTTLVGTAGGGAIGTYVNPGLGSLVGGIVGMVGGFVIGALGGIGEGYDAELAAKQYNENQLAKIRRDYLNVITAMTNYAIQKQESTQRNYN